MPEPPTEPDAEQDAPITRRRRVAAAVRRHPWRTAAAVAALIPLLTVALVVTSWTWIRWSTRGAVDEVADAPSAPVAIVLGAGMRDGEPSPYLAARLEVGAELLRQGKVRAILVSGDNGDVSYDEVTAMERWLLAHDVPADRIVKDHAGFDTWSSCTRAHRIFGVDEALVVTQDFHVRRAVYLCREAGIETHGVVARTEGGRPALNALREGPAAVKAVLDGVLEPDPRYLGAPESGVSDALAEDPED